MPRWRLLAITVIAFAGFVPSAAAAVPFDDKHFIAAIHDASVPQRTDVDTSLFDLSDANQRLVWRPGSGRQQLAVAALMTVENYRQFYASGSGTTPSSRPVVWVTLAPELRAWCRNFARRLARDGKRNATLVRKRVAQRLGLSPRPRYTRVVELWVDRTNVFRPCPDPEPTDRRCELQMQGVSAGQGHRRTTRRSSRRSTSAPTRRPVRRGPGSATPTTGGRATTSGPASTC